MNDNGRRCVNELYKKIVRKHDPDYCDPETLPMPALCALIHDEVVEKDLRLDSYNAEMRIKERELHDLKEKFDRYRLAVESLLRVPPAARENLNAIVRSYEHSKEQFEKLERFHDEVLAALDCPIATDTDVFSEIERLQYIAASTCSTPPDNILKQLEQLKGE